MKKSQIAVQLFTLRQHCKTATDLADTAARLRKIGYRAVQISAVGPMPEEEIVRIMKGEGLTICATHEPSQMILDETDRVIERLQRLGCKLTAYPAPFGLNLADKEVVSQLVAKLDLAGARFREAGMTLGYHNHAFEFVRFGEATLLDYIYRNTNPLNLAAELDTYWIHYGGGDVVEWCEKMAGRLPFIHLKDYCYTIEDKPLYCEIGNGNLRFDRIVSAAEASGCEWYIVEQDNTPGDPFTSIEQSFNYMSRSLCQDG